MVKNINVLIADDTTFMRATIKKMLSENGISSFMEAVNGKEAVVKYKNKKPDLVIMDISMPIMDGIEATRQIKNIDPEARILICSLQGQRNNVMEGIKAGARSFLVKPVKVEKLINEIDKIFDKAPVKPHSNESLCNNVIEELTESIDDVQASADYLNGIEEGYKECKREVATNMLRLGLTLETIRMCVELSDEEVLNYKAQFKL